MSSSSKVRSLSRADGGWDSGLAGEDCEPLAGEECDAEAGEEWEPLAGDVCKPTPGDEGEPVDRTGEPVDRAGEPVERAGEPVWREVGWRLSRIADVLPGEVASPPTGFGSRVWESHQV